MRSPRLLALGRSVQVCRTKQLWLNPLQLGFLISLFLLYFILSRCFAHSYAELTTMSCVLYVPINLGVLFWTSGDLGSMASDFVLPPWRMISLHPLT